MQQPLLRTGEIGPGEGREFMSAAPGDWLRARAETTPLKTAVIIDAQSWSYQEVNTLVDRLCTHLSLQGVLTGDHIALRMPNSLSFVLAVHAAARMGLVLVPINFRLTAGEVAHQLSKADCRWLLGELPPGTHPVPVAVIPMPADPIEMQSLLPKPNQPWDSQISYALDRLQAIVFTSGTTGFPKGAMLTFGNHFWSALGSAFRLGIQPDDRWLVCLPLYHVGGLAILFRACLYGTSVVIQGGFSPEAVDRALQKQRVTLVSLVPTMLKRLLEGRDRVDWPALRLILLGGAAPSAEDLARANRLGVPVAATYGLTECASQVATQEPNQAATKIGCAGRSLLFTSVEIITEDGLRTDVGEPGEIVVTGPTVMAGYYDDDEATRAVLRNGRFHTGDIGYLDAEGELWVLGRRTDLIVTGGENVYPAEVERVLLQHEAVREVAVVGLPDTEWGQLVAATIVPQPGSTLAVADLDQYVRTHLAGYKRPRLWSIAADLPLTSSGKVRRDDVIARLLAQQEANDASI